MQSQTRPTYTCPRCGIVRARCPSRTQPALCDDCRLVTADLAETETWR